jgi:hypothetical protein
LFNLIIWRRIQIRKFVIMKLSPFFSLVLSVPNILRHRWNVTGNVE